MYRSLLSVFSLSILFALILGSPSPLTETSKPSTKNADSHGDAKLGERCSSTSDCSSSYDCVTVAGITCGDNDDRCWCLPLRFKKCDTDSDCAEKEKCRTIEDFGRICTPPLSEIVKQLVCIDAEALQHMGKHELVFEEHQTGRVLCDGSGSCATPGHLVSYRGDAMMMKSFCQIVECQEKVMMVNSPRYRVGLRVSSKTEGLEYTAFAARYESRAEEASMAAAVRMGF